ncbi:hypothetical protein SV7mr_25000 [Stieleria bergensis]|uniref:Transcription factor zinc-finger domain-containing protein n=1 Tax=Stieleria bergensis TaxID=2528025 RepID=A0A517SV33_9BACT|nr:hypothetical protein SV7mr_25000 [Planctomycetes bacterium SV_7m_r]
MSQNPTINLPTIKSYHVKPSITGSSVKYQCPVCEARLRSSLMDADKQDYCPDCGAAFIVPGSPEKLAEAERRLQMEDAKTEAVSHAKNWLQKRQRNESVSKRDVRRDCTWIGTHCVTG